MSITDLVNPNENDEIELQQIIMQTMHLRKQILIVDDEIFNIEAAKAILECRLNLNQIDQICESALNGQEAIQKVKENV